MSRLRSKLDEQRVQELVAILLLFIPEIEIEICHYGSSAIGLRKDTVDNRSTGRECKLS